MDKRKRALLSHIIKEHVETAQPVSSSLIRSKYGLGISSATIRNEMVALEKEGYIHQPHTSAGRIPTEKGYRYYIENFLEEKKLALAEEKTLNQIVKEISKSQEEFIKKLAKGLAQLSEEAVVVGFSPTDVYYTGISNIFRQPEFSQVDLIYNMSEIVDHLDEVVENLFEEIDEKIKILIGKDNPFGEECGTILTQYRFSRNKGMLGILGPMRMPYEKNISLVKYAQKLLMSL